MGDALVELLPLFVDVKDMRVLVVGGGKVGTKRASKFSELGAQVTVYSLEFSPELESMKVNKVRGDARELDEEFLSHFDVVVTATNDQEINRKVCSMAKSMRKLCNDPTSPPDSNFIVPIYFDDGTLAVAVTTYGRSSLSSKYLLDLVKDVVDGSDVRARVDAMYEVKKMLKSKVSDPSKRFKLYSSIFSDSIFQERVAKGDVSGALKRAEEVVERGS
ncbi:siroheme synthase [Sulfodiicoccus acidiphilus]|uniref:precorrin-2 dehydrogenase n=1 Tax=Sulfodiicoccus acidiphilus TaxID=1670455 RepID=A0A348B2W3_9CREN|nr:bifunctional precorrin-2 dehydrogenase/sirohydrochlorin ferrochelatase [Sulfodiicoccus acidiphilus]BBD72515.1 siroheme synthase [Sulfodiicoccus acidiphilus]GGT93987.1 siroheme synthase [Sulfodiicoccus acidiphilus]